MHLRDYLAPRGAKTEFCRATGFSAGYVTDLCRDKGWPGRAAWQKIVAATDGRVTPNDHLQPAQPEEASANGEGTSGSPAV